MRFIRTTLRIVELIMLYMFFGLAPIAGFFMATVLFSAIVFDKESLGPWVLWSLLPGVFIDVLFLKRWVGNAYKMSVKVIGALYIFYSVCALGFFMGVPAGCIFLSVPAGVYSARRFMLGSYNHLGSENYFKRAAIFTAAVMALICVLLALWAIAGRIQHSTFQTPFISFTFTWPIFLMVVITGGAFMVLLQYWLTRKAARVTFKLCN